MDASDIEVGQRWRQIAEPYRTIEIVDVKCPEVAAEGMLAVEPVGREYIARIGLLKHWEPVDAPE